MMSFIEPSVAHVVSELICDPIENSIQGIQTIPFGAGPTGWVCTATAAGCRADICRSHAENITDADTANINAIGFIDALIRICSGNELVTQRVYLPKQKGKRYGLPFLSKMYGADEFTA